MAHPEDIQRAVSRLDGPSRLLAFREIQYLPEILSEHESLEALVGGLYLNKQGLLIATNQRAIFFDRGLMFRIHVEEFPYRSITSVQHKKGMLFGEVQIYASGNKATVSQIQKDQLDNFIYVLNRCRGAANSTRSEMGAHPQDMSGHGSPAARDLVPEIERLGTLKAAGLIDESEFVAAKRKLLGISGAEESVPPTSNVSADVPAPDVGPEPIAPLSWASEQTIEKYRSASAANGGGFGKRRTSST